MLGFQDIFGLKAAFGEDESKELLGICDNKAILHLGSPEGAQWASDLFHEKEEEVVGTSRDPEGRVSIQTGIKPVRQVLPLLFHELPLAESTGGEINGYFHHPGLAYRGTLPAEDVAALLPLPDKKATRSKPFLVRPVSDQTRNEWGIEDLMRLGIKPATKADNVQPLEPNANGGKLVTLDDDE